MRKFLVAAVAVLGMFSDSASAHGPCKPADPFAPYFTGCPGVPDYRGPRPGGYIINGPRSVMPYAIGMPPGPIQPRVYYAPRVIRRTYGGFVQSGLVQTGYRVQAYSWQRYHVSTVHGGIHESLAHGGGIHQQVVNVPD